MQPDRSFMTELVRYKMPFGKYQGQLIIRLPEHYLVWFAQKGFPEGKLGMMLSTMYEIRLNGLEDLLKPYLAKLKS